MPPATLLQARQLRFGWGDTPLFNGLDVDIPPGLSLITGEDGCGKSSLLRLLAGELPPQAGSLHLTHGQDQPGDAAWRQQVFWIDPQTDAHDALAASTYLDALPSRYPRFSADALAELIDGFGLQPHLAKPLYMLSAGSRRKVWLSAAFAAGTPVTLIDQPFAALDGAASRFLRELLTDVAGHPSRAWVIADHERVEIQPALTLTLPPRAP